MSKITCEYFEISPSNMPAREFIQSLDASTRRKFYFTVELLKDFGHRLGEPHAKYLGNSIFELRLMGREGSIRILYFYFIRIRRYSPMDFLRERIKHPKEKLSWL